ncbi:MAG TPA: DUF72 domain-containing protein [Longimicrobium sp.]|nr:DUF72 domain-containing protein [Longimicrobium sp.]
MPRDVRAAFPEAGSHLARYAARFPVAEINSSFHRPHRPSTYARWADETPPGFRFAAKLPKTITHQLRLAAADEALDTFLAEAAGLGEKLAALLVQLPPSFAFDAAVAAPFFAGLAARTDASVVCEPRHPSWFEAEADALLASLRVARVAADPARVPAAAHPGGWRGLTYHRLHGSPRMYYSSYPPESIRDLAEQLREDAAPGREVWCIFDNTASGAAAANALELVSALAEDSTD